MIVKNRALLIACITFICTFLVTALKTFEAGYTKGIWCIWLVSAWNYYAYAFDRQMLPWVWVELQGHGRGKAIERTIVFWITAFIYLSFLAVMAFADS